MMERIVVKSCSFAGRSKGRTPKRVVKGFQSTTLPEVPSSVTRIR